MQEHSDKTIYEFIQNIRPILWTLSGVFTFFSGVLVFIGGIVLAAIRKYVKQSTEQNKRIAKLETELLYTDDKNYARSKITDSVYTLPPRIAVLESKVENLESITDRQEERCERRHEK
jgi:hypothetical protein